MKPAPGSPVSGKPAGIALSIGIRPEVGTSIYAFLSNPTLVDYPGYMAAVFFTSGCNFRCGFCHNPDLLRTKQRGITWERLERACARFTEDWTTAAAITGGEPTLAGDLPELIAFFKGLGWRVKLDTNGSRPEVLAAILPEVDYVAMDVKAGPDRYRELTGFGDIGKITDSIALLIESGCSSLESDRDGEEHPGPDYELRTTLIEPFHDNEQLRAMGEMIRGTRRYVLQAFIPRDDMPDAAFSYCHRTSPDRLREVQAMMAEYAEEVLIRGE